MKNKKIPTKKLSYAIVALTFILLSFVAGFAQTDRNYVAASSVDTLSCGALSSPCRTFTFALSKTNIGGEIIALESGVYDTINLNLTYAVTLTAAPGVHAELSNPNNATARISINVQSTDTVILRNLYLSRQTGSGSGYGIDVKRVGTLHIENCVINGFNGGINFDLDNSAQVFIDDTTVRNSVADGVAFFTSTGLIKASVENSHFDHNGTIGVYNGLAVYNRSKVTVRGSTASGNGGAGFVVAGGDLNLEACEASNNKDGVITQGDSVTFGTAVVSNSTVTNNSRYGFYQLAGDFYTLGNNMVRRNTTNTFGTINLISGT
jgi:hypothetical protein